MNEENRNPNTELNEAELANVSGGTSAYDRAKELCTFCNAGSTRCTGVFIASLCAYLAEHGEDSVASSEQCPFYRR